MTITKCDHARVLWKWWSISSTLGCWPQFCGRASRFCSSRWRFLLSTLSWLSLIIRWLLFQVDNRTEFSRQDEKFFTKNKLMNNWINHRFHTQQEGTRKYFYVKTLQNSISHTGHTVLKFIDIQHITNTRLVQESRSRLEQPLLGDDYAGGHREREAALAPQQNVSARIGLPQWCCSVLKCSPGDILEYTEE